MIAANTFGSMYYEPDAILTVGCVSTCGYVYWQQLCEGGVLMMGKKWKNCEMKSNAHSHRASKYWNYNSHSSNLTLESSVQMSSTENVARGVCLSASYLLPVCCERYRI